MCGTASFTALSGTRRCFFPNIPLLLLSPSLFSSLPFPSPLANSLTPRSCQFIPTCLRLPPQWEVALNSSKSIGFDCIPSHLILSGPIGG